MPPFWHLTMNDLSPTRAADILDMLITIYNEEAIKDKNRIAVNTAEFTKERLQIIEHELGSVETDIEDLKRANNGSRYRHGCGHVYTRQPGV